MSHFVKVETKITDLNMLKQALDNLGITYNEAVESQKLSIKGWEGEHAKAIMEIDSGCSYGIGLNVTEEGNVQFEADWWAIETYAERTKEEIVNEFTRQYAYETVLEKVRAKGYELVNEEEDNQQNIRLVLRKWQ